MTPAEYRLSSIILPCKGADNGLLFPDFSVSDLSPIIYGDAKTVLGGNKFYDSCLLLDGSGDFLYYPNVPEFYLDADFSIQLWAKILSTNTSYPYIFNIGDEGNNLEIAIRINTSTSKIYFAIYHTASYQVFLYSLNTYSLNTWYHLAACRIGDVHYFFIDGFLQDFVTVSHTVPNISVNLYLGNVRTGSSITYFNGNLQDVNIIKGQGLWNADFTPPDKLVGTISGATDPANRIVTVIPRSNPTRLFIATPDISTGHYSVEVPNMECTVNILQPDGSGLNDKTHRARPDVSPMLTEYGNTSLLLPLSGANNGTSFPDWGPLNKSIGVGSGAITSTAQSKFYGSSAFFNATGYLSLGNPAVRFGTQDFTIAFWINLLTNTISHPYLLSSSPYNSNGGFYCVCNGASTGWGGPGVLSFNTVALGGVSTTTPIRNAGWKHIAIVRFGNTLMIFTNGILEGTKDVSGLNLTGVGGYINAACLSDGSVSLSADKMYMQDFISVIGAALWTENFVPPGKMIIPISGTVSDFSNQPASRIVVAVPRASNSRAWSTVSDAGTGAWSIDVPNTECTVIAQDSGPNIKPDIIARVTPS